MVSAFPGRSITSTKASVLFMELKNGKRALTGFQGAGIPPWNSGRLSF
jgi:hypothetical protein